MNQLIGIVGRARAGKDTVAAILNKLIGAQRIAFADPLREFCRQVFDFSEAQVNGGKKEWGDMRYPRPDGTGYLTPRHAMQTLGTEWGRACYANVWVELGLRRAAELRRESPVVIADVRFENEAEAIRAAGGVVWRVVRPGLQPVAATHVSETEQDKIEVAFTLVNDGSLEQLEERVAFALCPTF